MEFCRGNVDFRDESIKSWSDRAPQHADFWSKMVKDIESGEPFRTGISRGHVPMHEHGTKVYPDGTEKSTKVFLDAVWPLLR